MQFVIGAGHLPILPFEQDVMADFCAGQLEAIMALLRVKDPEVHVRERAADRCIFELRWRG